VSDRAPRLLVVGDSLAFPRRSAAQDLDDAWPQLLADRLGASRTWVRARQRATCVAVRDEAAELASYLSPDAFDLAIVQVGIVDVSPRPFPLRVQQLLDGRPKLNGLAVRVAPAVLRIRRRAWVDADRYEETIDAAVAALTSICRRVALVETAVPGPALVDKLGAFGEDVQRYNERLRRVAARHPDIVVVVDVRPIDASPSALLADGHHLSSEGHALLASAIVDTLARSSRSGPPPTIDG